MYVVLQLVACFKNYHCDLPSGSFGRTFAILSYSDIDLLAQGLDFI